MDLAFRIKTRFTGGTFLFFALCLARPLFAAEPSVLDGRIFQGASDYAAVTNEDLIQNVVRKVDAAILGRADGQAEPDGRHRWRLSLTVLECYKGGLQPGDKIYVSIYWDEGNPDFRDITGTKGFYFINKRKENVPKVGRTYQCGWIDIAPYKRYGEPMRKLLRQSAGSK